MMRVRAFAIHAFILASADAIAGGVPPSVVPVHQQFLPDGKPIYSSPMRIGGTFVDTGLDTGSIGLRVLPDTLRPGDARDTGQANSQTYGSNVVLDGTVGLAHVRTGLADRSTPIQLVSTVSCKVKGCPYDRVMPPSAYRLEATAIPTAASAPSRVCVSTSIHRHPCQTFLTVSASPAG